MFLFLPFQISIKAWKQHGISPDWIETSKKNQKTSTDQSKMTQKNIWKDPTNNKVQKQIGLFNNVEPSLAVLTCTFFAFLRSTSLSKAWSWLIQFWVGLQLHQPLSVYWREVHVNDIIFKIAFSRGQGFGNCQFLCMWEIACWLISSFIVTLYALINTFLYVKRMWWIIDVRANAMVN